LKVKIKPATLIKHAICHVMKQQGFNNNLNHKKNLRKANFFPIQQLFSAFYRQIALSNFECTSVAILDIGDAVHANPVSSFNSRSTSCAATAPRSPWRPFWTCLSNEEQ